MQKGKPRNARPHNREYLNERRGALRKRLTSAEAKLWTYLQQSQLEGRKFRRQHSVGNYIIDFYCPSERLGVELDGEVHQNHIAEHFDGIRSQYLATQGIKLVRIENYLVFEEPEYVLAHIKSRFGWWKESDK